jgi:hypothetical protein
MMRPRLAAEIASRGSDAGVGPDGDSLARKMRLRAQHENVQNGLDPGCEFANAGSG